LAFTGRVSALATAEHHGSNPRGGGRKPALMEDQIMRAFVIATLVALMGYGVPTLAQQSAASSNAAQMTDRSGKEVTAKKDAGIVRTRASSINVSEVQGRR